MPRMVAARVNGPIYPCNGLVKYRQGGVFTRGAKSDELPLMSTTILHPQCFPLKKWLGSVHWRIFLSICRVGNLCAVHKSITTSIYYALNATLRSQSSEGTTLEVPGAKCGMPVYKSWNKNSFGSVSRGRLNGLKIFYGKHFGNSFLKDLILNLIFSIVH